MRVHEFCPHRAQDVVLAILDQAELPSIEDHADVGVLEVVLLIPAHVHPRNLTQQVLLEITWIKEKMR